MPAVRLNMAISPWGGREFWRSERKNQIATRGIRKEKRAWPMPMPLRERSSRSFATRGDLGRNERDLARRPSTFLYVFVEPCDSGVKRRTDTANMAAIAMTVPRSATHENAV